MDCSVTAERTQLKACRRRGGRASRKVEPLKACKCLRSRVVFDKALRALSGEGQTHSGGERGAPLSRVGSKWERSGTQLSKGQPVAHSNVGVASDRWASDGVVSVSRFGVGTVRGGECHHEAAVERSTRQSPLHSAAIQTAPGRRYNNPTKRPCVANRTQLRPPAA